MRARKGKSNISRRDIICNALKTDYQYYGVIYCCDFDRSGCECGDDICRCARITDIEIVSVDLEQVSTRFVSDNEVGSIYHYCLERILTANKVYEKDNWDFEIEGGYYGEEMGSIKPNFGQKLIDKLYKLSYMTNELDMIKMYLMEEYGYILPKIEKMDQVNIKEINIDNVRIGADNYFKKVSGLDIYDNRTLPVCLCIDEYGSNYRLIDGHHRYCSCIKKKLCIKKKCDVVKAVVLDSTLVA